MNSKKFELLLGNTLLITAITIIVLILHQTLQKYISPNLLLDFFLVLGAVLLYLFLGSSMIDNFLTSDKKLKTMVDETLHELNTPIATIEANITMLKKSITDEKNLKRLNRIKDASKNLIQLYESIEYNIKENIEHVEKNTFNLKFTIDASIEKFQDIKNNLTITNEVKELYIKTDKNGFIKMLENLISNAIKYNKKDGFVKVYTDENNLCIQDSGIGIDTKNLFIIFDKSFQENPTTKGFGLGLSIVKSFCDKHKIKIKIDTKLDKGTIIILDIKEIIDKNQ